MILKQDAVSQPLLKPNSFPQLNAGSPRNAAKVLAQPSFPLHKQRLQSEAALIKGTNLSRSNQVAVLARAADNCRLFDQKYIIFSMLPAWVPLSGARK